MKLILLLSFLGLFFLDLSGQDKDPYRILDSLKTKLENIGDYSADIEIEVDVDFINMPKKYATIYFKQPDKIKFRSKEFIMLPKRGLNNNFAKLLNEPFSAIYTGEENLNGVKHDVIKIIPLDKKPDVIMATWWINQVSSLISRVESTTRNEGTYTADFYYEYPGIVLPSEMDVSFEIENMKLPMNFIGKAAGVKVDKSKMSEGKQTGMVYIRFSNYEINTKMDDVMFEEEENIN